MGEALDAAKRYYELFAAGDLDATTACFDDGCVTETPAGAMSNSEHQAFGRAFKDALPDARMEIVRAVETGNEVFLEGRFQGTHKGDLATPQGTIPASGHEIDLPYADYFRVENRKIVAHHVFWDQAGMMVQLGAAPPR